MVLKERPIFIVGVHRSGTTLLRFMLSSHPRLYVSPESDFIPRFFRRRPVEPIEPQQAARILRTIFTKYRFVREWAGDIPDPASFFEDIPVLTPALLLNKLYATYARQHGALRWGDKTPIYTSYMDLIDTIFPTAQFIHIIRDGRDVALSMLDKWAHRELHIDLYFAAKSWKRRIAQALAAADRIGPQRYFEVRYEELVSEPESVLRRICVFLGEEYIPEMSQPHILGREQVKPGDFHDRVRQPPSSQRIARWKNEMSKGDLWLFESVAGIILYRLGYGSGNFQSPSARDRIRLGFARTKYQILQAGRNILQAAGVFHPN